MRKIGGIKYLTWEDTFKRRQEVRVEVYLGAELKAEVQRRADEVGLATSPYIRDIIREYLNTHSEAPHHYPQEEQ